MPGGGNAAAQTHFAAGQGSLLPPNQVVLYIHSSLKNTWFIDPLLCALRRVLKARVEVRKLDLPLDAGMLANPHQLDAGRVAAVFYRATLSDGGARTFKYLLMSHDLKFGSLNYVFAMSFPAPANVGVVSTARIDATDPNAQQYSGAGNLKK